MNRKSVLIVYGTAFLQGLTMVSFPASSSVFKDVYGFTNAQYGLIFIPQLVTAILGSVAGGGLARRVGLRNLLAGALLANAVSQALLGSVACRNCMPAFYAVLAATAMFGLAFGFSAAPLNTFPGLLFSKRRDTAIVALHTLLGIGLAVGPLLAGALTVRGHWIAFPLLLSGVSVVLAMVIPWTKLPAYVELPPSGRSVSVKLSERLLARPILWTFIAIVILYAFAEGTFSNWAVVYLHEERGIELTRAALALSIFWATMAGGRLLISVLLLKIAPERIWLALPLLMIGAFLLLPFAHTPVRGIALFAFAGLACSAFFPISVGLISKQFSANAAFVSSLMIASLMIGVGVGSYVIGPLRSSFSIETLYQLSALYPASVFVLALMVVKRRAQRAEGSLSE